MKPIYFLAGLAPVAALVSCASPKAVAVNEQTLEPILAAKIVYAPRVPSGPVIQPGGSSPLALARKGDAVAQPTAAAAPAPALKTAPAPVAKKETPSAPAPVSAPPAPPAPAPKKPVAVNAPKPQKPKAVAKNEETLPDFDPPPQTGGNDGLRMPNMLDLPKEDELRSKTAKGKSAPDGGPVIIRPPANADKKPKSE